MSIIFLKNPTVTEQYISNRSESQRSVLFLVLTDGVSQKKSYNLTFK